MLSLIFCPVMWVLPLLNRAEWDAIPTLLFCSVSRAGGKHDWKRCYLSTLPFLVSLLSTKHLWKKCHPANFCSVLWVLLVWNMTERDAITQLYLVLWVLPVWRKTERCAISQRLPSLVSLACVNHKWNRCYLSTFVLLYEYCWYEARLKEILSLNFSPVLWVIIVWFLPVQICHLITLVMFWKCC